MQSALRGKTVPDSVVNPYLILIFSLAAGSFAAIFMRFALNAGMPPLLVAAGRLAIGTLILTPMVFTQYLPELRAIPRSDLWLAIGAGVWVGIHFVLLTLSLEQVNVLTNQVLVNTGPIWVALLEVTFLRTKLNRLIWLGLLVGLAGSAIITLSGEAAATNSLNIMGSLLALFAAVAAAVYIIIGRKVRATVSLIPYIWIVFGCGALTAGMAVLLTGTPLTGYDPMGIVWVILLAIIVQVGAHAGFNYVLGYLPATIVSTGAQTVTVASAVLAFILFAEVPTSLQIVGSIVIILGVILAIIGQNRRKSSIS